MNDYKKAKKQFEREFIMRFLAVFKGDIGNTSKHINISESTMRKKIKDLDIDIKKFMNPIEPVYGYTDEHGNFVPHKASK